MKILGKAGGPDGLRPAAVCRCHVYTCCSPTMQESRLCPSAFRLVLSLVARQHVLVFILFFWRAVTISNFDCPNAEKHSSIWPSGWSLGCTSAGATMPSSSLLLPSRAFPGDCKIATCPFVGDVDGGVVLTSENQLWQLEQERR